SLQIHACHTRLREVQVLHDQLRGLLEDPRFDPPLQPREIAVLAPDIDPYAPYIEAVFGGLNGRSDFIPYALADASPIAAEPLAAVFLQLLALPVSRFGLSEILDLLATPALAEQAHLDAIALERLRTWLLDAGARWGIDAAHRTRHDAPRDDACTWAFALDRLLLGHASDDDTAIAGVAPYTELEGSALDAVDALIRVLRVLARHERVFATAMTPAQWRERLLTLFDALLPQRPRASGDQRTLERLHALLDDFAKAAGEAEFDAPVPPEVVRAHFQGVLTEADTRAPLLTGGVSFGRMVPMRLLPFRVIALLGMNDGEFPRRDPAGGLNKLAADLGTAARRHGDRSLRDDDRFLFLQLFAAANDVLYLSYLGADPRDGSEREPSVLVAELLDVAARYHRDPDAAREQLQVRQPLQPFAPAAFGADESSAAETGTAESRRFSYRSEWRPAAQAGGGMRHGLTAWLREPLPIGPAAAVVTIAELRNFLCDPPRVFLRERLAVRLPDEGEASDDVEPLMLPGRGWQRQQLQRAVFAACVERDIEGLQQRLRAQALLPSGPLGTRQLERLLGEVRPYAEVFRQWRAGDAVALNVDLDLDGVRLQGRVEDAYPNGLARFRFDELHGPAQIAHGLDWLVLSASGDARPLAQFAASRTGVGPHLRPPVTPTQARAALHSLLTLRAWGLCDPLPFLPRAGWHWYDAVAHGKDGWGKAEAQWHGGRSWGEGTTASARLALRGRDPFADAELGESFRHIATQVFDAVVHGRSEDVA
ncbi:MAG TPA: exodeoxyribonuclease V subunit gamma, partial [Lysobacter sp.]|nr:exodeoxyribonuclease V subunit gamma [Lysobacter sp.]